MPMLFRVRRESQLFPAKARVLRPIKIPYQRVAQTIHLLGIL